MIRILVGLPLTGALLLLALSGCSDQDAVNSSDKQKLILGDWNWVYTIDNGQKSYRADKEMFWSFGLDNSFHNLQDTGQSNTAQYVENCPTGTYAVSGDSVMISCDDLPDSLKLGELFFGFGADSLTYRHGTYLVTMKRVDSLPSL